MLLNVNKSPMKVYRVSCNRMECIVAFFMVFMPAIYNSSVCIINLHVLYMNYSI